MHTESMTSQLITWARTTDNATIGQRLKQAREQAGFESAADAARFLGVREPTYSSHENGSRGIPLRRAQQYASAYKVNLDWLLTGRGDMKGKDAHRLNLAIALEIRGSVRAGVWLELNDDAPMGSDLLRKTVPLAIDPRFGHAEQYVLRVEGASMNKVALSGEYIVVADWVQLGQPITDDDLVVVRRERAMTYEITMKRVKVAGDKILLWPESTDPRWQEPIDLSDGETGVEVRIIGLVIGKYTPRGRLATGWRYE